MLSSRIQGNSVFTQDRYKNIVYFLADENEIASPTTKFSLEELASTVMLFCANTEDAGDERIETFDGPENAHFLKWSNEDETIEFWKIDTDEDIEDGWAVLYQGVNKFLAVGNYYNHPFVLINDIAFENSDGSTPDDYGIAYMTIDLARQILIDKPSEYIFDQIH